MSEEFFKKMIDSFDGRPPDKTSTVLIGDLERLLPNPKVQAIINKAKAFMYDDFKSESATPKNDLYRDAFQAGLHGIMLNVKNGIYD